MLIYLKVTPLPSYTFKLAEALTVAFRIKPIMTTQRVNMLASKPEDLSSIPKSHIISGDNNSCELSFDFYRLGAVYMFHAIN